MLHKGPVPRFVHGVWEYLVAILLIASPFLLDVDHGGFTAVAIVLGVALIGVAAASEGPPGLVNEIPLAIHAVIDFVLAGILIASPFVFGFNEEGGATALFIVLGVVHLVLTIATQYVHDAAEDRAAA